MRYILVLFCFSALFAGVFLGGCKKDELDTDPKTKLSFSEDTVYFDTVFVTLGSITKRFRVYNNSDKRVLVSDIRLAGGGTSQFRLNIDGMPVNQTSDLEIEAKDSIFIFVEVTVDPNNDLAPFVVADSILFTTNGNIQNVKLVAYGQNADFFRADQFTAGLPPYSYLDTLNDTHWTNDKPKVIIGYLVVYTGRTLTIDPGTKIHLYNNSGLWIYKGGTLIVNGTPEDSVMFQGVRKELDYKEESGQWDRIWINQGSTGNKINYAVIKNGNIGIQAENVTEFGTDMPQRNLLLTNSRIRNMKAFGIYGVNYNIDGSNTIVSNCGSYAMALTNGGSYRFRHMTVANYWSGSVRSEPAVFFSNYKVNADNTTVNNPLNFSFSNGIIYGNKQDNSELDFDSEDGSVFNWKFTNTVLKVDDPDINTSDETHFQNMKINVDPAFLSTDSKAQNYKLAATSSAIDAASLDTTNAALPLTVDILGASRVPLPDAGAIEFVP